MNEVAKKFTVQKLPHPQGGSIWMVYRPDGMMVGSVAGSGAKFGEDPNLATVRMFLSDTHALEWVKGQCKQTTPGAEFDEVDGESRIVMAAPGDMSRVRN